MNNKVSSMWQPQLALKEYKWGNLMKKFLFRLTKYSFGSSITLTGSSSMLELLETIGNSAGVVAMITNYFDNREINRKIKQEPANVAKADNNNMLWRPLPHQTDPVPTKRVGWHLRSPPIQSQDRLVIKWPRWRDRKLRHQWKPSSQDHGKYRDWRPS